MNVMDARLCVQCGELHVERRCPVCLEENCIHLRNTPIVQGERWPRRVVAARRQGMKEIEIITMGMRELKSVPGRGAE